jgi:molybdopterin-guanine dinucleotide biosynthesis protein A
MGTDKALQRLGGKSVIEHVIAKVAGFVTSICVVVNDVESYAFLKVPLVSDIEPDTGPLMGLYTGLISSKEPWSLAVACDTPFLEPRLIEVLLTQPRTSAIIATEVGARLQPLPGLYSAQCADTARTLLSTGRRALRDLLAAAVVSIVPEAEVRQADPDLRSFLDLDTPEDLLHAKRLLHTRRSLKPGE